MNQVDCKPRTKFISLMQILHRQLTFKSDVSNRAHSRYMSGIVDFAREIYYILFARYSPCNRNPLIVPSIVQNNVFFCYCYGEFDK
jgi:hypothetical protein